MKLKLNSHCMNTDNITAKSNNCYRGPFIDQFGNS